MPEPSYARRQQCSPHRPLDWRWQRAQHLVDTNARLLSRRDDELTLRAARYLRAVASCRTNRPTHKLLAEAEDIQLARNISVFAGPGRLEIEARLLAREAPAAIAEQCSVSLAALMAYEGLYFNVTDRLEAHDYIAVYAIGLDWPNQSSDRQVESVIKAFGYFGGSLVLDLMLFTTFGIKSRSWADKQSPTETIPENLQERARLAVAVATMPYGGGIGSCNVLRLYELTGRKPVRRAENGLQTPAAHLDQARCAEAILAGRLTDLPLTLPSQRALEEVKALPRASA